MKRNLFVSMLTVALLGGQVLAAQGTSLSGGTLVGDEYFGTQTETAGAVSGGHVLVSAGTGDFSAVSVYGGYDGGGTPVRGNSADMTGGEVGMVYGGSSSQGDASYNTAAMSGGTTGSGVVGGFADAGSASNNTVAFTGGSISVGEIDPGYTRNGRGTSAGNTLNVFGPALLSVQSM